MTSKMKAELFCLHCNKDTPHVVSYAGTTLKSVKCIQCGSEIEIRREKLIGNYATKPYRIAKEVGEVIKKEHD